MKISFISFLCICFALPAVISAQEAEPSTSESEELFVFLDCNARNCDFDHVRLQIPWVNWVRDRKDGQLHLLITDLRTGGGGRQYTLDYIILRDLEGEDKSLTLTTDPNNTDTEARNQLTNMISLGLIEYVEDNPDILSDLILGYEESEETTTPGDEEEDPWNLWIFRTNIGGGLRGEAFQSSYRFNAGFNANRVSEEHKFIFDVDVNYNYDEFDDVDDGDTFINIQEFYSAEALSVWSLGPNWSAGVFGEINRSTFFNRDLGVFGGPAIEYNIFPYSETTRRSLVFRYVLEYAYFNYELTTIEGMDQESLPRNTLYVGASIQQPWGEIFAFVEGILYFHDPNTHRINTLVSFEYRLFRGFNIDLFARYSRIKDQFFLPAEGLSPEEILTRRRQRETDFSFNIGLGFSYFFGSRYANVVNPRID